jgi:hypothetical protein
MLVCVAGRLVLGDVNTQCAASAARAQSPAKTGHLIEVRYQKS